MVRGTVLLCVCYIFDVSFFFVKQKTAYEMRISDWSSDVCSSDLEDLQGEPAEYWWNGLNRFGSLCLIDSAWDLRDAREGTLLLRYAPQGVKIEERDGETIEVPIVRAFVSEVRARDNSVLHVWDAPLPADLATAKHIARKSTRLNTST